MANAVDPLDTPIVDPLDSLVAPVPKGGLARQALASVVDTPSIPFNLVGGLQGLGNGTTTYLAKKLAGIIDPAGSTAHKYDTTLGGEIVQSLTQDNPAMDKARELLDWSSDVTGAGEPKTPAEQVTRAVAGALIPVPGIGPLKALNAAAKDSNVGLKALEYATPLTFNATPKTLAANAVVSGALDQGVRAASGQETFISSAKKPQPQQPLPQFDESMLPPPPLPPGADLLDAPVAPLDPLDMPMPDEAIAERHDLTKEKNDDTAYTALASVGAIGAALFAGKKAAPYIKAKLGDQLATLEARTLDDSAVIKKTILENAPNRADAEKILADIDTRGLGDDARTVAWAETGQFPNNSKVKGDPLTETLAMFKSMPEDQQKLFDDYIKANREDRIRLSAMRDDIVAEAEKNGAVGAKQYVAGLDDTQLRALAQKSGVAEKEIGLDVTGTGKAATRNELDQIIAAAESNPEMMQLAQRVWKHADDIAKFGIEQGVMGKKNYDEWLNTFGKKTGDGWINSYAPGVFEKAKDESISDKIARIFGFNTSEKAALDDVPNFGQASRDAQGGLMNPVDFGTALGHYAATVIPNVLRNKRRGEALDAFVTQGLRNAQGKPLVERLNTVSQGKDIVNVTRDGSTVSYRVSNPELQRALEFQPRVARALTGVMNRMRQWKQSTTTGILRPLFAPIAMSMDAGIGSLVRPAGTSFGYIDKFIQQATKGRIGFRGDPTALLVAIKGAWINWQKARNTEVIHSIYNELARNPALSTFDKQTKLAAANSAMNAAENQLVYQMHLHGASNSNIKFDEAAPNLRDLISTVAPYYNGEAGPLQKLWHFYKHALESVHNGARTGFFEQNIKNAEKLDRVQQLAADTRKLSGDPTRRGDGKDTLLGDLTHVFTSSVPYSNIAFQSLAQMGKVAVKHPLEVAAGAMASIAVPAGMEFANVMMMPEEYRQHYYNMPDYLRHSHFIFYLPGMPPENAIMMRVAPELAPIKAFSSMMYDNLFGGREILGKQVPGSIGILDEQNRGALVANMQAPFAQFMSYPVPPAIGAMLGMAGFKAQVGVDPSANAQIGPIAISPLNGGNRGFDKGKFDDETKEELGVSMQAEAMLEAVGGVTAQFATSFVTSLYQGYKADGLGGAFDRAVEQVEKRSSKSAPYANVLFGDAIDQSTMTSDNSLLHRKEQAVQKWVNLADSIQPATRKSRGDDLLGPVAPQYSPQAIKIAQVIQNFNPVLQNIDGELKDIAIQKTSVKGNAAIADKRDVLGKLTVLQNTLKKEKLERMHDIEFNLERVIGHKVSLEDLKPE